ncbi:centromere protein F isoform X2 [Mastacembelus armatus]|uniref:centromere protein F isoform X2 n=1 Tax=Mastacembelus armatus TaxID=205130 RepID=UPI000E45996F|nr:centromere protein F-like isoform X2 [Mastacembelus armatus]
MSWAEEDWTVGLSGRVLQKVKELQVHQERLSRENKQKQLQLDNIHTNLEKQTAKYEEVRGQLQSVQRELQSVREEATAAVTCSERLTQELQAKQAQVCSLEGQLNAARTLNNKLTQEIKRLEAELEKLQNSTRSGDTTLFSTPCWNTSTPWEHSGSRKEERLGQQDEGQNQAPHIRRLQFSDVYTPSLPRQQHKSTLHRHPSDQSESFSTPSAVFPWEQDDARPATRRQPPSSPHTPCTKVISQGLVEQGGGGKDHRTETDISLSEMRSRVSSLEDELSAKAGMLKTIQNEVVQSQKELAARELSLQKTRDELSLAHTRMAQESERVSAAEQRLKQLQEELKCQRQNAESSRLQHQQRTKELEKQHQRDLTECQKERQCLERQHQQEVNKLSQELQQARTLHNALQAQADKLSLQKQALDKELDTLKEKLKWTEGQLQESLKKGAQTQAKLMEAVREAEGVAVSLEQSRKRERALEEEGKRLAEEQADALRLLKELQELKAAPPLQPVQFCPIGQSFSPQPPYSVNSHPSSLTKRPTAATQVEWKREEDVDGRRVEITASYPSDREPGEGIDSEHITAIISPDSECLPKRENEGKSNEDENRDEAVECDTSGTNEHSTFSPVLSTGTPTNTSIDHSAEKTLSLKSEQTKATEDLKRENASLRSELRDVREELQKRLEDLEAQRRAETEARTRLKQLSRKHASQAVEKEQQDKEWKVQLESERAETERLRKALAALEAQIKRGREEKQKGREEEEEEKNKALEDRESEMVELNIQLKKQLAEVKAQLTLEREERKREEEERNQKTQAEIDSKNELSTELAELRAELERNRKEDSLDKENLSVANSPLTYLTLRDDELNCNIISCDNKPLPSPAQHVLFCESTNQRNMLVSQTTADLIQGEKAVTNPERSLLLDEGQTSQMASVPRQNDLAASPLSDSSLALSDLQKAELVSSDMAEVVARLQEENAKETERANHYQVKLEALQSQVTLQTQQLTMAFEKQSQHISGLLAELQEKESALFSQGEELQHYRQELDALKAEKEQEVQKRTEEIMVREVENGDKKGETRDEKTVEISALQLNLEKGLTLLSRSSMVDYDSNVQTDVDQPKIVTPETLVSGATDSKALLLQEQHPGSVESDETQGVHHSTFVVGETKHSEDGGNTDVIAELLALRQDNQLLKQRIKALTVSETSNPEIQTYCENQEVPVEQRQNSGNVAQSCLRELGDIAAEGQELLLQNETRMEDGGDLENGDIRSTGAEEELEEMSQLKINHLEQQMMALQTKVLALTEQTQQQAEELAVWRLASQLAPTFDEILPHIDNRSETQDQICAVRQCTVIREDELFLSCCSNKLQGQMLFSRLQHTSFPEPKCLPPSKKTSPLQENHQDTAKINKESEKENLSISFIPQSETCSASYKEERGADLVLSLDKWDQQHDAKDLYEVPGISEIKTAECHTGNPETEPISSSPAKEINTTSDSSDRDFRPEMKSVSSQTEESLCPRSAQTASELQCVSTQTEEEEDVREELMDSPPVTSALLSEGTESGDNMLFSGSFPIPADPARLAERIRRNRTQLSAAFDDTEYEPYGLPEVVMKGFADIPTGASCPYIVRRGLLGTTVIPVPQKDPGQEEETD